MLKRATSMLRIAIALAAISCAFVTLVVLRDTPAAEKIETPQGADDVQDLLFLASRHPVLVRLHIQNGGRSFRQKWDTFVKNEFQANDENSDGQLSVDEIRHLREHSDPVISKMLAEMFESSRSRTDEALLDRHTGSIRCVAFSPDGKTLASGGDDETVKLWDLSTGQIKATLKGHSESVRSVEFSPDGKLLASACVDETIKLWDCATNSLVTTLEGHDDAVTSVAFSPDGKTLASGGLDNVVKLWNVAEGKATATLEGHRGAVWAVAFSPNGRLLASGGEDKTVLIWNVNEGTVKSKFTSPIVWSLAFSPNGKNIALSGAERDIELHNIENGKLLQTCTGHQGPIRTVSFSPDGKQLVSASWDKTVAVWDVTSGVRVRSMPGHIDYVHCARFSPDGSNIVSGGDDRSLRYWDASDGTERPLLRVGTVGPSQLAKLLMQKDRGPFRIRTTSAENIVSAATGQNASQGTATNQLMARLDDNRDGRVSPAELKLAHETLRKLDWDDNEMIELEELFIVERTYRRMSSGTGRRMRTFQPFVAIPRDGTGIEDVGLTVVSQYNRSKGALGDADSALLLSPDEIGLDAEFCGRFDADKDGELDASEVSQLILQLEPDFELSVHLGEPNGGAPRIDLVSSKPTSGKPNVTVSAEIGVTIRVENVEVQLAVNGADATDTAKVFVDRFKQADRDNNGYLESTEVANDPTFMRPFPDLDADGDGKVYEKEVAGYYAPRVASAEGRVVMSTFVEGRNLFDILDINHDGRLSRREFSLAIARINQWDTDGDGQLDIDEIPESLRVEMGRASSDLIGAVRAANPMAQQGMTASPATNAPAWFQKMDRNQDGDVSEREFLGPDSAFKKLDTNHDELIEPEEANAAQNSKGSETADERK